MYNELVYNFSKIDLSLMKEKMLNFIKEFSIFSFLDNCEFSLEPNRFEVLTGATNNALTQDWEEHIEKEWLFGAIQYEWNNHAANNFHKSPTESLITFFIPEVVLFIPYGTCELHILSKEPNVATILNTILYQTIYKAPDLNIQIIKPLSTIDFTEYERNAAAIIAEIKIGNAYEVNYCIPFKGEAKFDILSFFKKMRSENPSPFAALFKTNKHSILSASPERFLFKSGNKLLSQPIKGTRKRGSTAHEDQLLKKELSTDLKESAENTMVTDLVRNDLGKIAIAGTVKVSKFKELQSFAQVHQLVSTINAEIEQKSVIDILKATFPMGSMTGAPKHKVLSIINQNEPQPRGFYSGSLGYIMPNGDFDFNVVIRSLIYNHLSNTYSFQAGGALTHQSEIKNEWDEIQTKAKYFLNIFKVLED